MISGCGGGFPMDTTGCRVVCPWYWDRHSRGEYSGKEGDNESDRTTTDTQVRADASLLGKINLLRATGSEGTAMGAAPDVARRLVEVM